MEAGSISNLATRKDINPWIGDPALIRGFLGKETALIGANQRRRFGRLLFASSADKIRDAITNKVSALTTGRTKQCAFHLFATLGGGTGSGGLIDLITLIRTYYPGGGTDQFPVFVYVYLTNDTPKNADVSYFFQNQFTGLRDLNALICGRLHPQLLGETIDQGQFSGTEPINQVTVTAPLNSATIDMPLQTQLRVVAKACFERIVAWCTGQMSATARKMLSGEDTLVNFPGEPLVRPERSYRFSAFGMRRWEVPAEKLKTLLALDLLASALRQMLFNHWQDTTGYVDLLPDGYSAATAGVVAAGLLIAIEDQRRPVPKAEALTQRLRTALAELAAGLAHAAGGRPPNLLDIERMLEEFYLTRFEQGGVDALIRQRRGDQLGRVTEAVRRLEAILTELWLNSSQPLALARIPQVLGELGAQLRRDGEPPVTDDKRKDGLRRIIEARRREWDKVTWLSATVAGRRKALIAAQSNDCGVLLEADLRWRLAELDRSFDLELANRLPEVQSRFLFVQQELMRLLDTVKRERDQIDQELRALAQNVTANRYEFRPAVLGTFLEWMCRHAHHQQTAAALMRADILQAIGGQQPLTAMSKNAVSTIDDRLRLLAWQQAQQIHVDYKANRGESILEDSVLDILRQRNSTDSNAFLEEVGSFVRQAAVCLQLRNDTQPAQLLGAAIQVPRMPRRLLLLGLPQHAFTTSLGEIFQKAIPAGEGYLVEVFKHEDPGQIRLLTVDYWLAARFARVVESLRDKYQAATTGTGSADTRYFCNIDPDGEQDRRPDLFLLDIDTMRLRYEAELWLGQLPDLGVVHVDQNGVFLILEGTYGATPELLGPDLATASKNPDRSRMDLLHARLIDVLIGRDPSWLTKLLEQKHSEIKQLYGLTSSEYREWARKLQLLEPLVN